MSRRGGSPDRPLDLLTVAVPVILAGALCAYELSTRSLWLDEGATVAIASQHGAALWRGIARDGGNMLAYYLLLHVVIGLFGAGEAVIRLPSVLATAATAGLVAALGLRLFDRRIALSAAALTAISLPLVFCGQDARGYALMVALVCASFLSFSWVLDGSRWATAAYGVSTLLAIYVGFDAVLIVPAQLLLLFGHRSAARRVFVCVGVVALACIPLLLLAVDRGSSQLFWVPAPGLKVLRQTVVTLTSAGMPPNFLPTATTTTVLVVTGVLIVVALGLVVSRGRAVVGSPALLPALWLAVPAILALAAALAGEPIELARTSVMLAPGLALLVAWALGQGRLPWGAGWALIGVLLVLRVLQLVPAYGTSPENWHAAADYVLGASRGGACVAFYPQDGRMPFDYYVRGRVDAVRLRAVLPAAPWSEVVPYVERYTALSGAALRRLTSPCPRLWLIASHEGQRRGPPVSRQDFRRYQRLVAALALRYTRQRDRNFGYAAVVKTILFSR